MTDLSTHTGMIYDGRSKSWVTKPAYVAKAQKLADGLKRKPARSETVTKDKKVRLSPYPRIPLNAPHLIPAHQIDLSVSGLGAYRSYRSHPGRSFPALALTCSTGDYDKDTATPTAAVHNAL